MALDRALAILEVAAPIAETIPLFGTPVKGAFETTAKILQYAAAVKSNKEKTAELALYAATLCKAVTAQLHEIEIGEGHTDIGPLGKLVEGVLGVLTEIQNWTYERAHYGVMRRTLSKSNDSDSLIKFRQKLQDAFDAFMMASQIYITHRVESIDKHVRGIISDVDRDVLNSLGPVPAARYDSLVSPSGCLEGTRVEVIDTIMSWITQASDGFAIFWLVGHAGTGKSTIAKTLCERLALKDELILSSFFVSKSSSERNDPSRILYTFACDLAQTDESVSQHILKAIRAHTDIKQRPLKEQIDQLLVGPTRDLALRHPIILVLDALDECIERNGIDGARLIQELVQVGNELPIKLVVTSRMEDNLQVMFSTLPQQVTQHLHELEVSYIVSDVDLILRKGFDDIVRAHAITTTPWPGEDQIKQLTDWTGRLIIYASTVLKFVGHRRFSPESRLQQILDGTTTASASSSSTFEQIDNLYTRVLEIASEHNPETGRLNAELCERIKILLGSVILLQQPLSLASLAQLMGISEKDLECDLRALSSVLIVGPDTDNRGSLIVHIFHPSFRDFLLVRCVDSRFSIDQSNGQLFLAHLSLKILNRILRKDICRIGDESLRNAAIKDPPLETRVRNSVSGSALYACQFWHFHLAQVYDPDAELLSALAVFANEHLFHWVELLSLIGKLSVAAVMLPQAVMWCHQHADSLAIGSELHSHAEMLSDARRAILLYLPVLSQHALEIYYSVLITMPHCRLFERVAEDADNVFLRMCLTRSPGWSPAQMVINGNSAAFTSIIFSPDNSLLVSGAFDRSTRLWDLQTGAEVARLEPGHFDCVSSVAFSRNGAYIASGSSDKMIRIWDSRTRGLVLTLTGHSDDVRSVTFSPDGSQLLSGSSDHTLRIWDTHDGLELAMLEGHKDGVRFVSFSNDGQHALSGSIDSTARVWSIPCRREIGVLLGHRGPVTSGQFSPNGKCIVTGSYDHTIRIWSTQSLQTIHVLQGHSSHVRAVAYSPDGLQIASCSKDKTIRLWDSHSGQQSRPSLIGHSDTITSVVYAPNGFQIASSSLDSTIRLWETRKVQKDLTQRDSRGHVRCVAFSKDGSSVASGLDDGVIQFWNPYIGKLTARLDGHNGAVTVLTFSADSIYIASGSDDFTIRLWNILSRQELAKFQGHTRTVTSVQISRDSTRLLSGSLDKTVRLWDVQTCTEIALFEGHTDAVTSVLLSVDGGLILSSSSDRAIYLWDVHTRRRLARVDKSFVGSIKLVSFGEADSLIVVCLHGGLTLQYPINDHLPEGYPHHPVPTSPEDISGGMMVAEGLGWLFWTSPQTEDVLTLCWLPVELRSAYTYHGTVFVTASASSGRLIFIDFTERVKKLKQRAGWSTGT